jgi:hypothetical protein
MSMSAPFLTVCNWQVTSMTVSSISLLQRVVSEASGAES